MTENQPLFERLAHNISAHGFSIHPNGLPKDLGNMLRNQFRQTSTSKFRKAGTGRHGDFKVNATIRRDEILWIDDTSEAGAAWLMWMAAMRDFLNQRLFLGLSSFESHFAHYRKGDFYRKHEDAFRGEGNRILSVVTYLNADWLATDGGELVLFPQSKEELAIKVEPKLGTFVAFLSEKFPHEVLTTHRDRLSIAGWFRLNTAVPL